MTDISHFHNGELREDLPPKPPEKIYTQEEFDALVEMHRNLISSQMEAFDNLVMSITGAYDKIQEFLDEIDKGK